MQLIDHERVIAVTDKSMHDVEHAFEPTTPRQTPSPDTARPSGEDRSRATAAATPSDEEQAHAGPAATPLPCVRHQSNPPHAHPSRDGAQIAQSRRHRCPTTKPTGSPQIITSPAMGPARRLAGIDIGDAIPNNATWIGSTPSCAPSVVPRGSANHRGPGHLRTNQGLIKSSPDVAPRLSQNPTVRSESGQMTPTTSSVSEISRIGFTCRPLTRADNATAAMTDARITDGSKRVRVANHPMTASEPTQRAVALRRASNGAITANMYATFCPLTAVRCDRPAARNSSRVCFGDVSVVADDQAHEQRPIGGGHRRCTGRDRGSHPVHRGRQAVAAEPVAERFDVQHRASVGFVDPASNDDLLTGLMSPERAAAATECRHRKRSVVDYNRHHSARAKPLRVGPQFNQAVKSARADRRWLTSGAGQSGDDRHCCQYHHRPLPYDGAPMVAVHQPVPAGPLAYHRRIRTIGPIVAMVPPAIVLAVTTALRGVLACDVGACGRQVVTSWILPAMSLPTAMLWGIPIEDGTTRLIGVLASSASVWLLVGVVATRRATRSLVATWRDFWREYLWLALSIWAGVGVGLLVLSKVLDTGLGGVL